MVAEAREVMRCCRLLSGYSEEAGATTRTFLSAPMRDVHAHLTTWMERSGMAVTIDPAGNLRGVYLGSNPEAPRLFIGSHLDTVVHAGAFDGVLGVVLAVALVDLLKGRRLPFSIEVVGFSDEEGVRFGVPFIGSRALAGTMDDELLGRRDSHGRTVGDAIREFGLDPSCIDRARAGDAIGYVEFHIEQGPVLDDLGLPLAIVDRIDGQSRLGVTFTGAANHAGTTPMRARRDALACAAEWISAVEAIACDTPDLRATVGCIEAMPGAANVIAGRCETSLDVRHADDRVRMAAVERLLERAAHIASRRHVDVQWGVQLDQSSTAMAPALVAVLEQAVARKGLPVHHMSSGAGHDAMVMASRMPVAMLFLRSPNGISHHPDETVVEDDVAAALMVGQELLELMAAAGSGSWSMS
jgi:allantoate deiminase